MDRKKKAIIYVYASISICISQSGFGSVIQYFHSNTYTNPATFSQTKDMQFQTGVIGTNLDVAFKGQVFNQQGEAFSNESFFLPYFAFAKRINPKWTWGVNISQPISGAISFPANSVVANLSTDTYVFATDINPVLSYQISDSLSIGAGPVLQDYYQLEINFVDQALGHVLNRVQPHKNWVWGGDIGINWGINKTTYLGLAYFSKMNVHYRGSSVASSLLNPNFKIDGVPTPATTRLDFIKFFSEKWLTDFYVFYTQWHDVQIATLENVIPYNITLPLHYNNTVAVGIYSHYQLNKNWGLMGLLAFDQGAAKGSGVTISFPTSDIYGFKIGADYALNKDVMVHLKYGYFWSNAKIDHTLGLNVTGNEPAKANVVDLTLTYKV